ERNQRTISRPVAVTGIGLLSGADVCLRFRPADPETGLLFLRTDLPVRGPIAAHADNVTGTNRKTTLGRAPVQIALVEHVLAALAGLRIDNCVIEVNAGEPPGLDGSSRGFVDALISAGIETQPASRPVWTVDQVMNIRQGGATLAVHPTNADELKITYMLD